MYTAKGKKENFFAQLSDFGQADQEWEDNRVNPRARIPSFEIIFVYTQSEGALDIHAPWQHQVRGRPPTDICRQHPRTE